jgi:hypothetical protein
MKKNLHVDISSYRLKESDLKEVQGSSCRIFLISTDSDKQKHEDYATAGERHEETSA